MSGINVSLVKFLSNFSNKNSKSSTFLFGVMLVIT